MGSKADHRRIVRFCGSSASGKTTAMLHHALMGGRPFLLFTESKLRPFREDFQNLFSSVKNRIIKAVNIDEDINTKIKYWIKKGYKDIYIDELYLLPTQKDKNQDYIYDVLKIDKDIQIHISVQTYNPWIPTDVNDVKDETVTSNLNLVENKIVTRENGFIKVSGDFDTYKIDLNHIYD